MGCGAPVAGMYPANFLDDAWIQVEVAADKLTFREYQGTLCVYVRSLKTGLPSSPQTHFEAFQSCISSMLSCETLIPEVTHMYRCIGEFSHESV